MRKQTVSSPNHLQTWLNEIFDKEEENTVDNIYRCYCWLAYGGLYEDEAFKIKTNDVDFENMAINYNGREYPIYREALAAFRKCVSLEDFIYEHPKYHDREDGRPRTKKRGAGDILIRGLNPKPDLMTFRAEMSKKLGRAVRDGRTERRLSYYRVWLSGLFYRVYEKDRAGIQITSRDFLGVVDDDLRKKLRKEPAKEDKYYRIRIAKLYLDDYLVWKVSSI